MTKGSDPPSEFFSNVSKAHSCSRHGVRPFPAPVLKAYFKQTVIAEKLEALTTLGLLNSRMKDYYDLALLSRVYPFNGAHIVDAIVATFRNLGTRIEAEPDSGRTWWFSTGSIGRSRLRRRALVSCRDRETVQRPLAPWRTLGIKHSCHPDFTFFLEQRLPSLRSPKTK